MEALQETESAPRPALVGMEPEELTAALAAMGEPAFRARQVAEWIHRARATSFDAMTNLSRALRDRLAAAYDLFPLAIVDRRDAQDGSEKLLFRLASDGKLVEGVLMPDGDRMTLCLSSQVGCAVDCTFCMTGRMGFRRQLTAGEILGQVLLAANEPRARATLRGDANEADAFPLTNIVFMGMGEPLLNVKNVFAAVEQMTRARPDGLGLSPRRITISTAGVVAGIDALAESRLNVNLAVSLNASTDAQRDVIMPINKAANIGRLLAAARRYPVGPWRRMTFEYVLLAGFNDTPDDARRLATLVGGIRCKINLIPFNPDPSLPYERPTDDAVNTFGRILNDAGLTVSVRWSKGLDVQAACGQLAGRWEPGAAA